MSTPGKYERREIMLANGQRATANLLIGSPWLVLRDTSKPRSISYQVLHLPTGQSVRRDMPTLAQAKSLAETIHAAHPKLPALNALPHGAVPDAVRYPEAKAEALKVLQTILKTVQTKAPMS